MQSILETERLYFRKFTLEDAPLLLELNRYPEVVKYVHEPVLTSVAEAKSILETIILPQYQLYNLGRMALHLKATNEFIGWCGLKNVMKRHEIDLGYRLHPYFWNRGYATEAAKAQLEAGLNVLNFKRIIGRAHIENTASLKILRKIGMQFVASEFIDQCPVETYEALKV
jgi:RimJ/RimL family protein N-acetyltransferase